MRDGGLAGLIARSRSEVRGIYGAPKTFFAPRRMGVRASMRRAASHARAPSAPRAGNAQPGGGPVEDPVKRRFEAGGADMARFADIAYVKTRQGRLYPTLVMDIWSRRIVGWAMGPGITAELADETLKMALTRRNNPRG